jgi:hypothetical protein
MAPGNLYTLELDCRTVKDGESGFLGEPAPECERIMQICESGDPFTTKDERNVDPPSPGFGAPRRRQGVEHDGGAGVSRETRETASETLPPSLIATARQAALPAAILGCCNAKAGHFYGLTPTTPLEPESLQRVLSLSRLGD